MERLRSANGGSLTSSPGTPLRVRPFGNPIGSPSRRRSGVFYLPSAENTSNAPLSLFPSSGLLSPHRIFVISPAEPRLPADRKMNRREPRRTPRDALPLLLRAPLLFYLCSLSFTKKTQKKMRTLSSLLRTCLMRRNRGLLPRRLIISFFIFIFYFGRRYRSPLHGSNLYLHFAAASVQL